MGKAGLGGLKMDNIVCIRLNKETGMYAVTRKKGNGDFSCILITALSLEEREFLKLAKTRNESPYMIRWS
jgi:hypothetical protein